MVDSFFLFNLNDLTAWGTFINTPFPIKAAWGHLDKPIIPPGEETTPLSLYLEALKWGQAFYSETKGAL